jgi:ketosteroid isomerase-like protein
MRIPACIRLIPIAFVVSLALAAPATAQSASADPTTSGPLYDELARLDSILFDAAFYSCDAAKVNSMFTDDVEFYHDVGGAAVGDQVRAQFASLAASCPRTQGVTRVLVPGSLRVYPMNGYGAVQTGTHRFVQANETGIAMFVHLWKRGEDGTWKIARVISFDHHADPSAATSHEE